MEVSEANKATYTFDGFRLDAGKRLLFGPEGTQIPLMPKAFEILQHLVSNSSRIVEKDELMDKIWPDTAVEENNLTQNISAIRKALGERHKENRFIATIPGRGYKFVAEVEVADSVDATPENDAERSLPDMATVRMNRTRTALGVLLVAAVVVVSAFLLWPSPRPAIPINSIAVLPFKPISLDRRDESVEMGMADTLILKLSGVDNLKVQPLTAVRRFAAPDQDAVAAGRELGVDAVLDGRLQTSGDRIRANIQLIRVGDGETIWSGQFDEKLTDIFTLQDSIAQRVAAQLRISLGRKGTKRYTESVVAYQMYMLGNLHTRRLIKAEVEKGLEHYQKAIEADPQFALAYVEIANANRALVLTSDDPPKDRMPTAMAAAVKAVELDTELAEAWTALAISDFWYEWNWKTAEERHLHGIDLDPNNSQSRTFYAHLLSNIGRHNEAVREISRAREIDPASLLTNTIEGQVLFFAGETGAAEETLKRTIELDQRFWLAHLFLTRVYIVDGRWEDAISAGRKAAELSGGNAEALATIAYSLAMSGKRVEAEQILAELTHRSKVRFVPRYAMAQIHLALGDRDAAIANLQVAFEGRESLMTFLKVEPKWDPLREDPRFQEILSRMNLNS